MTLENNDRYLYFQDQVGVVRQAIYNDVSQVPLFKVVASDARNHTPLAVLSVPSAEDPTKLYGSDDKSERVIYFQSEIRAKVELIQFPADLFILYHDE